MTARYRHCEGGTTEAIWYKQVQIASSNYLSYYIDNSRYGFAMTARYRHCEGGTTEAISIDLAVFLLRLPYPLEINV